MAFLQEKCPNEDGDDHAGLAQRGHPGHGMRTHDIDHQSIGHRRNQATEPEATPVRQVVGFPRGSSHGDDERTEGCRLQHEQPKDVTEFCAGLADTQPIGQGVSRDPKCGPKSKEDRFERAFARQAVFKTETDDANAGHGKACHREWGKVFTGDQCPGYGDQERRTAPGQWINHSKVSMLIPVDEKDVVTPVQRCRKCEIGPRGGIRQGKKGQQTKTQHPGAGMHEADTQQLVIARFNKGVPGGMQQRCHQDKKHYRQSHSMDPNILSRRIG